MQYDPKRLEALAELFKRDQSVVDEAVSLVLSSGSVERAADIMKVPAADLRRWLGTAGAPTA